jgi:hypothetical protein
MSLPARVALATTLLAACAPARAPDPPRAAASAPDTARVYRYQVDAGPRAEELAVTVDVPAGSAAQRWAPAGMLRPYVRDVAVGAAAVGVAPVGAAPVGAAPVPLVAGAWEVPACPAGCRLRYRILLADAARGLGDHDLADLQRGAFLAPPSSWLLRPAGAAGPFQLAVRTPAEVGFVTGLARSGEGFTGDVGALVDTPYAAFGPMAQRTLALPGGALDVALVPGAPAARAGLDAWIDSAARAVAAYYGRFPIPRAALIVRVDPGAGIGGGHTMGNGGGAVLISVGEGTSGAAFGVDWLLVHEMVHLSFPDVARPWAEEGLATYLEPIIRARAGLHPEGQVWRELVEGLPQGQPEAGDGGLDHTDTWGRRYWGGAMFWFLADLEIRERTGNRRSLDDALRAVNRAGGNVSVRWELDRVLGLGDEAVGVAVLRPLRRRLGEAAAPVDLAALWKRLGVSLAGGRVVFDEGAPLSGVRRAITGRAE